ADGAAARRSRSKGNIRYASGASEGMSAARFFARISTDPMQKTAFSLKFPAASALLFAKAVVY
ncbi:MAG: hypothetical protein ACLS9E_07035, partial [Acutalibacteraceae bacterium]